MLTKITDTFFQIICPKVITGFLITRPNCAAVSKYEKYKQESLPLFDGPSVVDDVDFTGEGLTGGGGTEPMHWENL